LVPSTRNVTQSQAFNRASLGCIRVMVALERHRLKHGAWPESVEAIDPTLLPQFPADPFRNAPLKVQKIADGWKIFSVGPENKPDGFSDRETDRVIFHLYDPEHRHQPPKVDVHSGMWPLPPGVAPPTSVP